MALRLRLYLSGRGLLRSDCGSEQLFNGGCRAQPLRGEIDTAGEILGGAFRGNALTPSMRMVEDPANRCVQASSG
ncbi:hypothetical protein D4765_10265 [Subtercola vilae]|uniref:Uncharacterized protein n=1 Tax=Subtercola vilae TaxID=2056433 RepID=A0A4T2BX23_9MICO|nr:hypothetical protein D4765_10265 [Subtercola vilae]